MEFNKNWTREDNNILREFIKQKKGETYIRNYFSNDKLFYHPNKKYYIGNLSCLPKFNKKIENFDDFLNEIKYNELKTDFVVDFNKSKYFKDEFDYIYKFKTNSRNLYIIDFIYLKDNIGPYKNKDIYNISFTLEKNIHYEQITDLNEQHEIIKRLIFIFKNFNEKFGKNCIYLIGETEDVRKINWYLNIIKDSFENIKIKKGDSSYTGKLDAYYIELL